MAEVRKRTRPANPVPKVRKRERPKAKPKKTVPVDPRMPAQWPSGSAVMRGPGNKKHKPYNRKIGSKDEENPNLIGRIVNDRTNIDPVYVVWRWHDGRYHWLCEKPRHVEAMEALSKAAGGW